MTELDNWTSLDQRREGSILPAIHHEQRNQQIYASGGMLCCGITASTGLGFCSFTSSCVDQTTNVIGIGIGIGISKGDAEKQT